MALLRKYATELVNSKTRLAPTCATSLCHLKILQVGRLLLHTNTHKIPTTTSLPSETETRPIDVVVDVCNISLSLEDSSSGEAVVAHKTMSLLFVMLVPFWSHEPANRRSADWRCYDTTEFVVMMLQEPRRSLSIVAAASSSGMTKRTATASEQQDSTDAGPFHPREMWELPEAHIVSK